ncbi:hypothetical protein OpiT1DRAFT_05075 [Opitutaceae bacterium TAV1]|nr:hypothetical protein OpiT1DRAFT_05075 [Opitutaceae bacterium TAV1]
MPGRLQISARLRLLAALLPGVAFLSAASAPAPAAAVAWDDIARGLFHEAHQAFAAAGDTGDTGDTDRETRLGTALTLLQLQPKTDANIRRAATLLTRLHEENPGDETGLAALYYLGRIEHLHRTPADPEAAARYYRELISTRPDHPLAGQARVKLALIELYRSGGRPEDRAQTVARLTPLADRQPDAASRRDLHLVLGEAALRFGLGSQLALDHFRAALEAGILRATLRADTLVRCGELARELGHADEARRYYETFLADFRRDVRRRTITETLAALSSPAALAAAP